MVRVCSVWPTLNIWCKKFHIEGPSLFPYLAYSKTVYFRARNVVVYLHSHEHPIQGIMVRVCSVWPTLITWMKKFHIEGPSLFAIPSQGRVRFMFIFYQVEYFIHMSNQCKE